MKANQLIDIQLSESAVAWALLQAKEGDREAVRWLQDQRLGGSEAAARALVELALTEMNAEYAVSVA